MNTVPTVALDESHPIGFEFDWKGRRMRLVGEITRDEFLKDLEARRRWDREHGLPPARAGEYTPETREFRPTKEVDSKFRYFYRVEPVA